MNLEEEVEFDCILARANYIEGGEADEERGSSPELPGAVDSPTLDAVSAQGMTPHKGSERELQTGVGFC